METSTQRLQCIVPFRLLWDYVPKITMTIKTEAGKITCGRKQGIWKGIAHFHSKPDSPMLKTLLQQQTFLLTNFLQSFRKNYCILVIWETTEFPTSSQSVDSLGPIQTPSFISV